MKMDINKIMKANAKILRLFEADKVKYDIKRGVGFERLASLHLLLTCGTFEYTFWSRPSEKGYCVAAFSIGRGEDHLITISDERCDTIRDALDMYDLSKKMFGLATSKAGLDISDLKSELKDYLFERQWARVNRCSQEEAGVV